MTVLNAPVRFWACPACDTVDRTQRPDVHTQYHNCPGTYGLNIPLVEVWDPDAETKARQVPVQSEFSYNVAAVRTERADGSNDVTVFPQPAVLTIDSGDLD